MSVNIHILYDGQLRCAATHGPSGQVLTTDAPIDNGGKGSAFSPTDLVATGLGACLMTIMGLVAQRDGLDLADMEVDVVKDMASSPVRRIALLKATVKLPAGKRIPEASRAKLEAAARACPVKQSLHPDVGVQIDFVYPD